MKETIVQEDPLTGDLFIQFDKETVKELGWNEGDTLVWKGNHFTWYVSKKYDTPTMEDTYGPI
jgi:hypothetical protein